MQSHFTPAETRRVYILKINIKKHLIIMLLLIIIQSRKDVKTANQKRKGGQAQPILSRDVRHPRAVSLPQAVSDIPFRLLLRIIINFCFSRK